MVVKLKTDEYQYNSEVRYVNGMSPNVGALIEAGGEIYKFASENVSLNHEGLKLVSNLWDVDFDKNKKLNVIIDLSPVNLSEGQARLHMVNTLLEDGGIYIGCSNLQVRESLINYALLKNNYNFISKAEILGRLVNAGFSIVDYRVIEGKLFFCVINTDKPMLEPKKADNWVIPMTRIGRSGKELQIFKFRTMYPYSEYLQDYVVGLNGYNEKGKPQNDFRLTRVGRLIRKFWIDELPQVFNLLKGELALVGVRPLSKSRFNELPEDVRKERIKYKPGCIPPYVALRMPDSVGNIQAERIYFEAKSKYYYWTDVKYFFLAVYNVLTGRITSS